MVVVDGKKRAMGGVIVSNITHHVTLNSSSTNGHIATVFGCTGFLGRYVVSKLGMCVVFG